jgi:hypothetical protein
MNKIDCTCLALVALALVVAYVIFQKTPIVPALQGCQASAKRATMEADDPDETYDEKYNNSTAPAQSYRFTSGGPRMSATPFAIEDSDGEEEKNNKGKGVQSKEVKDEKAKAKTGGYVESTGRGKKGINTDVVYAALQSGKEKKYSMKNQEEVTGGFNMSDYGN